MTGKRFTLMARLRGVSHAARGLKHVITTQHNAWIHIAATLLVSAAAWYVKARSEDWRWLILAIALVWGFEIINTAIEKLCDVVSPERNPLIGMVKDVAAGAVLVSAIAAALIGLTIFWPYLHF